MNKKLHHSLRGKVLRMTVVPLILLAILITGVSFQTFSKSMEKQVQKDMEKQCKMVLKLYENSIPGDFSIQTTADGYQVLKGNQVISNQYEILDGLKEVQEMDVSIFYKDTRVLTTLLDAEGDRRVDIAVSPVISNDVLKGQKASFYNDVTIENVRNYAYYEPIYNADGTCFGMIGISKPAQEVQNHIKEAVTPLILLCFFATLFIGVFSVRYSQKIVDDTEKIAGFMKDVSEGNFSATLDSKILNQTDELGELGRVGLKMQKSIRVLVEFDMLTGLHNRRYADGRLHQVEERLGKNGSPFCVCIADIDFFKKVNDTYGHEAGDLVLKQVSQILKKNMVRKGFAARWGGEEFLLVFEMMDLNATVQILENILEETRNLEVETVEGKLIKVTMSMGVVEAEAEEAMDDILRKADERLYYGKTNGRNQIVSQMDIA